MFLTQPAFITVVVGLSAYRLYSLPGAHELLTSNADELLLPALYDDLSRNLHYFIGWHFGAVHYFFPDLAEFSLLRFITGDFIAAAALLGVIQHLTLFYISRALFFELGGKNSWVYTIVFATSYVSLIAYGSGFRYGLFWEFYAYSLTSALHFGTYELSLVCFILYIKYATSSKTRMIASVLALSSIGVISDLMFVFYFIVPSLVLALVTSLVSLRESSIQRWYILCTIAVAAISELAYKLITPATAAYTSNTDISQAVASTATLLSDIMNGLAVDPLFLFICILGPLGIVSVFVMARSIWWGFLRQRYLQSRSPSNDARPYEFTLNVSERLAIYVVVACVATLTFVLGFHLYVNVATMRYLGPLIYGPALIIAMTVSLFVEKVRFTWKSRVQWVTGTCVVATGMWMNVSQPEVKLTSLFPTPEYVHCFDGVGAAAGISGYWQAKPLIMFSSHRLQVSAVLADGSPFLWADNAYWYVDSWQRPGSPPNYDFIYVKDLSAQDIGARYGQPDRIVPCEGSEIWFYNQPNAIYSRLVQGNDELVTLASDLGRIGSH